MSFLRNYWYCAAWASEVTRTPLARTLLNEKVVLYRKEDGGIIALGNVCPHRFAPMHEGKLHGDVLACPYHGLQFAEGGACVHNPHGAILTDRLSVKGYPIVERYGAAWIWMGEPALADERKIPEFIEHSDPSFRSVYGRIPVNGSYELVSDNLLDLSHTQYLHAFLTHDEDTDSQFDFKINLDGNTLTTAENRRNIKRFGFAEFVWPDVPARLDSYGGVRWEPPANMRLKVHFAAIGKQPEDGGRIAWGAELVTPETETSCHYFWSFARNYRTDEAGLDEALKQAINSVFTDEDAAIIARLQENMGNETDLMALHPVILPTDKAAVQARMIVRKLLKDEAVGVNPAAKAG